MFCLTIDYFTIKEWGDIIEQDALLTLLEIGVLLPQRFSEDDTHTKYGVEVYRLTLFTLRTCDAIVFPHFRVSLQHKAQEKNDD